MHTNCNCKICKHEIVKKTFDESNCELIGEISLSKKLTYRCACGKINSIRWHNFKNGERCRKCSISKTKKNNPKRLKVANTIHSYFKENNCVLLEEEYINQKTPMRYICECKNESTITWKNFKKGSRCKKCAQNKIKNRFIPCGKFHFRWNPNREEIELNKTIRSRAKQILKRTLLGKIKNDTTFKLLGYAQEELKDHIKNHKNWEQSKKEDWEIDHYFPISAFFEYNIFDVRIINCLENLRPLSKLENRTKNSHYDKEEFEEWLKSKSYIFTVPNA